MIATAILYMHHGGCFQKFPHLVYSLGQMKQVECDIDYLSVGNILDIVIGLGYIETRIKKIYFSKPELPFEDNLVSIENDEKVHELIVLCKNSEYVCLYVEHNDEVNFVKSATNDNESDDGRSDYMADDEYDEYGSNIEEYEVARIRREKHKMYDEMVADLDGLRAENREHWEGSNAVADIYAYYQDSDDVDSLYEKEKKRIIRYPWYNASSSKERVELEVGLKFTNK
ncbi:hypothetical protein Cgig2_006833 [Carnegiea gigantea]|uniref:PB1-like domain-containing protein n=1 Tax=Carnegiea gigantea TaxID=171969 RepID=A0A9Q1GZE6_9CARY|nr:hypothetical protein Cgig2_006833 [Carnegiea gigantea]